MIGLSATLRIEHLADSSGVNVSGYKRRRPEHVVDE
jgi:hypothetical protein